MKKREIKRIAKRMAASAIMQVLDSAWEELEGFDALEPVADGDEPLSEQIRDAIEEYAYRLIDKASPVECSTCQQLGYARVYSKEHGEYVFAPCRHCNITQHN